MSVRFLSGSKQHQRSGRAWGRLLPGAAEAAGCRTFGACLASALVAISFPAQSQQYPTKPVTVVVPFAAGGASDVLMRVITQRLSARLGQTFVIDNRAGANGKVGMTYLARAAPDGYTLGTGATATLANNPAVYRDLPYDAGRDFAAIGMIGSNSTALVVNKDIPVRSVEELLQMMRAKRRLFSYGSAGVGNTAHLAGELFKHLTKVEMEHVPYRGGNEIMRDLLGGQIQLAFSPLLESMPYVTSGRVRALAVTRSTRLPELPDIPTMIESGVPGVEYTTWQGVVAPAQIPRDIAITLNYEIRQILAEPETREALAKIVIEPQPMTMEEFAAFMDAERRKWGEVARLVNVRID